MNRYIDANALAYKVVINNDVDFINKITKLMIEAPSINIVRCKECCIRETEDCPMVWWDSDKREYVYYNNDDDYCSFGLADCSLCWKESHCRAIKEAEKEESNETK